MDKYYGNSVRDDHLSYFINSFLKSRDCEKSLKIQLFYLFL